MIQVGKAVGFREIGQRSNQEDSAYPELDSAGVRSVFVLCDGMGGHEKGEVASHVVATSLGQCLDQYLSQGLEVDKTVFNLALDYSYDQLDAYDDDSVKKMGTTMTCLVFNQDGYLAAHIGDSRIYHIRPSLFQPNAYRDSIMYRSRDHSLVNDLLLMGEITEEEARVHPQRNVITKVMQPGTENRNIATIHTSVDVQVEDYFFMCSDGVLEHLTDAMLCSIVSDEENTIEQKLDEIHSICKNRTRDNHTCWLIKIEDVNPPDWEDVATVLCSNDSNETVII